VTWLDGDLARTHRNVNPSLDDSNSFYLDVHSGMVRANIGDLGNYLNTVLTDTPLQHISLLADSDQLKMTGTLKKIVPLPIELVGQVSTTSDNRIRLHVTKLDVLKIPLKGLLGFVKISLADFFKQDIQGVEINGNDLLFDTQKLMPAPRIRGQLTKVRVVSPDIEEVYGGAVDDGFSELSNPAEQRVHANDRPNGSANLYAGPARGPAGKTRTEHQHRMV
jgi:hypothetical protein